jgi:hypothetical protein
MEESTKIINTRKQPLGTPISKDEYNHVVLVIIAALLNPCKCGKISLLSIIFTTV